MPASVIAIPASVAHDAQIKMDEAARSEAQSLADAGAAIAQEEGLDARGEAVEVVGSRGLSAINSALLGSVSAGVVHHSSRPVLVVHTAEDAETRV